MRDRAAGCWRRLFVDLFCLRSYGASLLFNIERARAGPIGTVFSLVEQHKARLGVAEYTISQATLEQVFCSIAKKQREEGA